MSFLFTASFSVKPKSKATVIHVNNELKIFQSLKKIWLIKFMDI